MKTIGIYGDSYAANNKKYDSYLTTNIWPNLLEKLTKHKVHNYALSGSNRYYTYKQLEKTLGQHDFYIIIHTYWYRKLYVDPIMEEHSWWVPNIGIQAPCPIPEHEQLIIDHYKYFYDFDSNKIASYGFNYKIKKMLTERNIDPKKVIHLFVDQGEDVTEIINDGSSICKYALCLQDHKEQAPLKGTPIYDRIYRGDFRPCHFSLPNHSRLASAFADIIQGKSEELDLDSVILSGDNPLIKENLEWLYKNYGQEA